MSKVSELADTKDTLFPVDDHPVVRKEVEDLTEVRFMLLFGVAGDEDVIQVDKDERTPQRMPSISLWNAWAAFLRPKGMRRNSQSPKGVMVAILGISAATTGIWW